jgi:hypothetical protein
MSDRRLLYDLLFDALLEIREDASEAESKAAFHLADLFHPLPKWLRELDEGLISADDVLDRLRQRAHERGIEAWLKHRVDQQQKAAASVP